MPDLKEQPTLSDIQDYVSQLEAERGFESNTLQQSALLLGEEVGELFKALRKAQNMSMDKKSVVGSVDEELADIVIYVCSIANRSGIDLEKAFRAKEEVNKKRIWETSQKA